MKILQKLRPAFFTVLISAFAFAALAADDAVSNKKSTQDVASLLVGLWKSVGNASEQDALGSGIGNRIREVKAFDSKGKVTESGLLVKQPGGKVDYWILPGYKEGRVDYALDLTKSKPVIIITEKKDDGKSDTVKIIIRSITKNKMVLVSRNSSGDEVVTIFEKASDDPRLLQK